MEPNFFATFVLAAYPLFILVLFVIYRPPVATGLSLLIAEMTLPPKYSLPIPTPTWLDKNAIPSLVTLVVAFLLGRKYFRRSAPFRGLELFFLIAVVGLYFTMSTNRDPLQYGNTSLPGEKFSDFISDAIRSIAHPWAAFFLGRIMFTTTRDLRALARMLTVAALIYTVPILIEIRMSPQINNWIYGYSASSFIQAIRWGGYRPAVLMGHGLPLAQFMLVCILMAIGLALTKERIAGIPAKLLCVFLLGVLVLCKSTGSIIYAIVLVPLLTLSSPRRILIVSAILAVVLLVYPLLQFAGFVPTQSIGEFFTSLSLERGQSLTYRFDMEQGMLNHTRDRPWFGWGGYARNFVYDSMSGRLWSVVDGEVIAILSSRGLFGFLAFFLPFSVSVVRAYWLATKIKVRSSRILVTALTLSCAIVLFDLIINSTFTPIFVLMIGALNGLVPGIIAEETAQASAAVDAQFQEA